MFFSFLKHVQLPRFSVHVIPFDRPSKKYHFNTTHKHTEPLPFAFPPVVNQDPRNCNLGNLATCRGTGSHPPSAPAVATDKPEHLRVSQQSVAYDATSSLAEDSTHQSRWSSL